jgi:hypothetical protein
MKKKNEYNLYNLYSENTSLMKAQTLLIIALSISNVALGIMLIVVSVVSSKI